MDVWQKNIEIFLLFKCHLKKIEVRLFIHVLNKDQLF